MNGIRLIFLGDISVHKTSPRHLPTFEFLKQPDSIIANLEGPIVPDEDIRGITDNNRLILFNSQKVLEVLGASNIDAVCLANNHIYDWKGDISHTEKSLSDTGVGYFGAGADINQAQVPFEIESGGEGVKVFGFGWDVIGCNPATSRRYGVNPFTPDHVLNTIKEVRNKDESSCVIFMIHWNYELELFPQPAHRQLAHELIDNGVDAIIGLHPHIVQGAEFYRGKPIVYSLGNWFFPARKFGPLHLSFSSISSRQLALELNILGREVVSTRFHWCQYDETRNSVMHEKSEDVDGGILASLTPFRNMPHSRYVRWFRKNRTQKIGLPIYRDFSANKANFFKDLFVKSRQRIIWKLVELGIKQ